MRGSVSCCWGGPGLASDSSESGPISHQTNDRTVKSSFSSASIFIAPLLLSACCHFAPCHFGSYIAGTVSDAASHRPISNAAVRLYHYQKRTADSGCFALGGPDALPFEFGVSAPGYKPIVVKAVPGSYWAAVTLVPEGETAESRSEAHEISRERYGEFSRSCP